MFHALKPRAKALFGALALLCLPLAGAHATETVLHSFTRNALTGAYPVGQLVLNGGAFYGVTHYGVNGDGDIYKMTTTGAVTVLHEFNSTDGYYPNAGLVFTGGNFYGTTYGVSGGYGTVFRMTPSGTLTTLHVFTNANGDGANVYAGLLLASDGNLYGVTYVGGNNSQGTIFMVNPSTGSYSVIHSFNNTTDTAYNPLTGLAEGTDGFLYGSSYGASGYNGGIYKIKKDGTGFAFVHGFNSSDPAGYNPESDLITASDGNIYGTCYNGGVNGLGTVYKLVTSTGAVTPLWSFDGNTGAYPGWYYNGYDSQTRLLQGADHNLYGVTTQGGFYGEGTAFKLTLAGACSVLTSFSSGFDSSYHSTVNPLVQDGTSFYTTSYYGGALADPPSFFGDGEALSISSTGAVKVLQSFYMPDTYNPYAGLVQDGTSFYGEGYLGGPYSSSWGAVYKIDSAGHYSILHYFNDYNHEGVQPQGGLLLDGTSLYGTTNSGGLYGYGTFFKITTKGALTVLYHFHADQGYNCAATLAMGVGTDKNLYGTFYSGGYNGYGGIFCTDIAGKNFKVIHYFNGPDGRNPICTPVPDGSGNLYGTCTYGGANGYGTIWKLSTNGATFTKLFDFDNTHGAYPYYGGKMALIGSSLYGVTQSGGQYGDGVIWQWNISTSAISLLHTFNNNNGEGYYPYGGLFYDSAGGNFYGTCDGGGTSGVGTIWKVNVSTGTLTLLHTFTGSTTGDGANPYEGVILGTDGFLYGTTVNGGVNTNNEGNVGVIFQQTTTP